MKRHHEHPDWDDEIEESSGCGWLAIVIVAAFITICFV
jgi:MOSC domain-containing protein YiiM